MLGAFAIVKSSEYGLLSARTLGVGGGSLALLGAFLALESRVANPIMPLRILRLRMLMGSSLVRGLLVTGMFSAFFLGALYLERVLGYDAIDTGLAFMPLTISIAVLSLGVSARAVERFGALRTLAAGLAGIVAGLLLLAAQGVHASYFPGLFFAFLLLGLGAGASFLPLLTMGMSDAPPRTPGWPRGSSTSRCSCSGRSGWRRSARSRPTTRKALTRERALAGERADRRLPPRLPRGRGRAWRSASSRRFLLLRPAARAPQEAPCAQEAERSVERRPRAGRARRRLAAQPPASAQLGAA